MANQKVRIGTIVFDSDNDSLTIEAGQIKVNDVIYGGGGSITGADASDIDYTPATSGDWTVVPDEVGVALDTLASDVNGLLSSGAPVTGSATDITYTPTTSGDWSVVPNEVGSALDTLATDVNALANASSPTVSASDVFFESTGPNITASNVNDAIDELETDLTDYVDTSIANLGSGSKELLFGNDAGNGVTSVETFTVDTASTTSGDVIYTDVSLDGTLTVTGTISGGGKVAVDAFQASVLQSSGVSITPDVSQGSVFEHTLTGNTSVNLPINMEIGQCINILLIQDGSGLRTPSFNASYKFAGGTPTWSTIGGRADLVSVVRLNYGYLCSAVVGYA